MGTSFFRSDSDIFQESKEIRIQILKIKMLHFASTIQGYNGIKKMHWAAKKWSLIVKRWSEAESFTIFENHIYSH